jgi:hypothetical protein
MLDKTCPQDDESGAPMDCLLAAWRVQVRVRNEPTSSAAASQNRGRCSKQPRRRRLARGGARARLAKPCSRRARPTAVSRLASNHFKTDNSVAARGGSRLVARRAQDLPSDPAPASRTAGAVCVGSRDLALALDGVFVWSPYEAGGMTLDDAHIVQVA